MIVPCFFVQKKAVWLGDFLRKVSDLVDVHTQRIADQRSRGTTSPEDGS